MIIHMPAAPHTVKTPCSRCYSTMKKKILIVVDMQKDFIYGSLGTPEARAIVRKVVEKIQNFNGDIIYYTKDTHEENYLDTPEGIKLPVEHCIRGTDGWNLDEEIHKALHKARCTTQCVEKSTFGSEYLVDAVDYYIGQENVEIEIVGLCTDICVVSNALLLKARLYDMAEITVDHACCAGVTPETHEAALKTMEMCQITVV